MKIINSLDQLPKHKPTKEQQFCIDNVKIMTEILYEHSMDFSKEDYEHLMRGLCYLQMMSLKNI